MAHRQSPRTAGKRQNAGLERGPREQVKERGSEPTAGAEYEHSVSFAEPLLE